MFIFLDNSFMDFEPILFQYTKINVVSNPFSLHNNTYHCIAVRIFLCIRCAVVALAAHQLNQINYKHLLSCSL